MRVIFALVALFPLCAAYPGWYNYDLTDLERNIARRSSSEEQYKRLEPRGGSLVSGRGAFRPGFAGDSLASILYGYGGRMKRMSPNRDDDFARPIDFVLPVRFIDVARVRQW